MKKLVDTVVTPPWRWVGGKGRLLGAAKAYIPEHVRRYFEPFFGGGAIYFAEGHKAEEAYLSDICKPLMVTYEALQQEFDAVWNRLQAMAEEESALGEHYYYTVRDAFNARKKRVIHFGHLSDVNVQLAAEFIYLMHCGYNGVYRENKSGGFNVPLGSKGSGDNARRNSISTLKRDTLWKPAALLVDRQMAACDFQTTPDHWPLPGAGDLVVYDPPYLAEYSQYNEKGFGEAEHRMLYAQAQRAAERGARVVLFNSCNTLTRSIFGEPRQVVQLERTVGNSLRGSATEAIYVFGP